MIPANKRFGSIFKKVHLYHYLHHIYVKKNIMQQRLDISVGEGGG